MNQTPVDELEALLQTSDPPLEDAGFSARVLEALPPPRDSSRLRAAMLLGFAALGGLVALVLLPGGELLAKAAVELPRQSAMGASMAMAFAGAVALAAIAWATTSSAAIE